MGMQMTSARHALALGLVLAAGFVQAAIADDDPQIVSGQAFLNAHPDIRWRRAGEAAYGRQRYGEAFGYFRDAARSTYEPLSRPASERTTDMGASR